MSRQGKTNAMRLLDKAGLEYELKTYAYDPDDLSGSKAAKSLGLPASQVYKTIVALGDKKSPLVFCLAVDKSVDLKLAARLSSNKNLELAAGQNLLLLTGYIRGGCSPLAMKKNYPVYFDQTVLDQTQIAVNAGRRGWQIIIKPRDLIDFLGALVVPFAHKI